MAVENTLASLAAMRIEMRLVRLRIEQARARFPATGWLLAPASAYLDGWDRRIAEALEVLRENWEEGNKRRWTK